jgi:WD40 repeat protein
MCTHALKHDHTRTHARTHASTHASTHALTHARTHTLSHTHTRARAHTHTHARAHTHTHTHTGTPTGPLKIYDASSLELLDSIVVATGTQCGIKSIAFSRSGDAFVVNSMDRAVRVYRTEGNIIEHRFQDVVNLNQWKVRGC